MKNFLFSAVLYFMATGLIPGQARTRTYKAETFSSIACSIPVTLNFVQSDRQTIKAHFPDNISSDRIKIESDGRELSITARDSEKESRKALKNVVIDISAPRLTRLVLRQGCKFRSEQVETPVLDIEAAQAVNISISRLKVKGRCRFQSAQSNSINIPYFETKDLDIDIHQSGKLESETIKAENVRVELHQASRVNCRNRMECTQLDLTMHQAYNFSGAVHAQKYVRTNIGQAGRITCNVEAETMRLQLAQASLVNGSFKGGEIEITGHQASNVDMRLECKSVRTEGKQACKLTLSGTADEVNIDGQMSISADISKLNQY